jgi:hypothetical protein
MVVTIYYGKICKNETTNEGISYSKSEEGKAFVHANCVFDAIQVNETSLLSSAVFGFVRYLFRK